MRFVFMVLALALSAQHVAAICSNRIWKDPNYTPPREIGHGDYGRPWADRVLAKRFPADRCPFRCPVCGMSYGINREEPFENQADANRCCPRPFEAKEQP